MPEQSRHDAWQAGESYDVYMGRWSHGIAQHFLDWLDPKGALDWLEVGCGTGALSASILARCQPASLVAVEPSEHFLQLARTNVADRRARFLSGDAQALPVEKESFDAIVSGLVINFVPDRQKAFSEMKRVARSGALIAFYVWDYPGGGMELIDRFWEAAADIDPKAGELAEGKRFPFCTMEGLTAMLDDAGLKPSDCIKIEVPTLFRNFEDYWHPFTLGAGPAPGYCMSLDPVARQKLKEKLAASLSADRDGSIALKARAWAIKAVIP